MKFREVLKEKIELQLSVKEYLFGSGQFMFPLSTDMLDRVFGKRDGILNDLIGRSNKQRVFHVTSPRNMTRLKKIKGTKKSISAFTKMDYDQFKTGITGQGGILIDMNASVLISSVRDIYSMMDKQGRRWIAFKYLNKMTGDWIEEYDIIDDVVSVIRKVFKNNTEVMAALNSTSDNQQFYKDYFSLIPDMISKKEMSEYMKAFYDYTEKLFKKYKNDFPDSMRDVEDLGIIDGHRAGGYNEVVVNQIEINNIYVSDDYVISDGPKINRFLDDVDVRYKEMTGRPLTKKNIIYNQSDFHKIVGK